MKTLRSGLLAGAALLLAGAALAQTPAPQTPAGQTGTAMPAKTADTSKGKALVDTKGMTLYVFDRDAPGKSNCTGQCATNWPPLMAASETGASADWTVVTREDATKQWAYKGKPLYRWKDDKAAGDVTGDGVNNVWHIAQP